VRREIRRPSKDGVKGWAEKLSMDAATRVRNDHAGAHGRQLASNKQEVTFRKKKDSEYVLCAKSSRKKHAKGKSNE